MYLFLIDKSKSVETGVSKFGLRDDVEAALSWIDCWVQKVKGQGHRTDSVRLCL